MFITKKEFKSYFYSALSALCVSYIAFCNESVVQLDEETITGSSQNELSTLTIGSFQMIDLTKIENKLMTLGDVLQKESSVQIRSTGSLGSYTTISLRGSSSNQVKVFIDGMPVSMSQNGSVDLSNLNINRFKKVEIYKGYSPATLGASSIGGVINLISKDTCNTINQLEVNIGSFGTHQASFETSFHKNKQQILLFLSKLESDGDFRYRDDRRTINDRSDDIYRVRTNNDLDQNQLQFNYNYDLNQDSSLGFQYSHINKDRGLAGRANTQTTSTRYDIEENYTQLSYLLKPSNVFNQWHSTLSYSLFEDTYRDLLPPSGELGLGKQHNDNDQQNIVFKTVLNKNYHNHLIDFSYLYQHEKYSPKNLLNTFQAPSSHRSTHSFGIQDYISLLNDRLNLIIAVHHEFIENKLNEENYLQTRSANHSSDQNFTYQFALQYSLSENFIFKTNLNKAYRYPTLIELFGDRGMTLGNNQLNNEKSLNYDLGINWEMSHLFPTLQTIVFNATTFKQKRTNLIQQVYDSRGVGRAINISEGEVTGYEINNTIGITKNLIYKQSLTLLDAKITNSQFKSDINKSLPGIYKLTWSPRLNYYWKSLKLSYNILFADEMYYDKTNNIEASDKDIHDFGLTYSYKKTKLNFKINNLYNDEVEDFNGWPLPQRHYTLTFNYSL